MTEMLERCLGMMESMTDLMGCGGPAGMPMGGMMRMDGAMGVNMLVALLLMSILIGLAVTVVWLVVRTVRRQPADAHRILDARYARGDLERDTYLRMCADLAEGRSGAS